MQKIEVHDIRGEYFQVGKISQIEIIGKLIDCGSGEVLFSIDFQRGGKVLRKVLYLEESESNSGVIEFSVIFDENDRILDALPKCHAKLVVVIEKLNTACRYHENFILSCKKAKSKKENTIWLLSGGGAKGCFQAGAITYLSTIGKDSYPSLISGTSVGSINAILPSYGWGKTDNELNNIDKLTKIWLSLFESSDMYIDSNEFKSLDNNELYKAIKNLANFDINDIKSFVLDKPYYREKDEFIVPPNCRSSGIGGDIIELLNGVAGMTTDIMAAINLISKYYDIPNIINDFRSFYSLKPMEDLMKTEVASIISDEEKINLRLEFVSLENYTTCWFDKASWQIQEVIPPSSNALSEMGYPHPRASFLQQVKKYNLNGNKVDNIIDCTLASAAIPLAFPPRDINLKDGKKIVGIDGGVTDLLPVQSAIEYLQKSSSKTKVISIYCVPLGEYHSPFDQKNYPEFEIKKVKKKSKSNSNVGKNIIDISIRSFISLQKESDSCDHIDIYSSGYFTKNIIDDLVIAPSFKINATSQIDPGLIRIQLAYGWMRAFDAYQYQSTQGNKNLFSNTDKIVRLRINAWRNETRFRNIKKGQQIWPIKSIETIRKIKKEIRKEMKIRIDMFGIESLPLNLFDANASDSWFIDFELHGLDWGGQPIGFPWDEHYEEKLISLCNLRQIVVSKSKFPSSLLNKKIIKSQKLTLSCKLEILDHDSVSGNEEGKKSIKKDFILKKGINTSFLPLIYLCVDREVTGTVYMFATLDINGYTRIQLYIELREGDKCDSYKIKDSKHIDFYTNFSEGIEEFKIRLLTGEGGHMDCSFMINRKS